MASCKHLGGIKFVSTDTHICEDCVKMGASWLHLRLCLECGYVGCCDNSPNKHATKHPLIRSIEPGEGWVWCYIDDAIVGELPP